METHFKRKVHREAISNNLILNHSVGWGENSEYKGENIWFGEFGVLLIKHFGQNVCYKLLGLKCWV